MVLCGASGSPSPRRRRGPFVLRRLVLGGWGAHLKGPPHFSGGRGRTFRFPLYVWQGWGRLGTAGRVRLPGEGSWWP